MPDSEKLSLDDEIWAWQDLLDKATARLAEATARLSRLQRDGGAPKDISDALHEKNVAKADITNCSRLLAAAKARKR